MKLKHVELYGFKSFADKTKLTFNKDISAVVGPNGSGKSNIADAIKWVLGEQSAKSLRGSNMQDVIFLGTENKKQMNMAQVSLILDNSDKTLPLPFEEVNVTRRVYRTGESEYLINKSPQRLKDIKELFLDTGVGKDGYSLIGQGRIDEILNGKPEQRREIFEEASGIAKNKFKKTEAERRLVKNEENLEKLNAEIKIKQQESDILEVQSNNAKEGMKLTSRLETLELNLLKKSIIKLDSDNKNDESKLKYIDEEINDISARLNKISTRLNPVQEEIKSKEEKYEALRELSIDSDKKLQRIDSEISLLKEKSKFYDIDITRLENDLQNKKDRVIKYNKDIDIKNKDVENYTKQKENLIDSIEKLTKEKEEYERKLVNSSEERYKLESEINELKLNISNLQVDKNTKQQLDLSNEKLKDSYIAEINNLSKVLSDKKNKRIQYQEDIDKINSKIESNTKKIESLLIERQAKSEKINEISEQINSANNSKLSLDSERNILFRQYKSYDGYYKSVQELLKISDRNTDIKNKIVGVLADLISIDDEYANALDVALGSNLQNIVINNEEDGKYLINFIKNNNIGRITFLPISKISGKKQDISHPLAIDTLNNLVKFDKKIENIINFYLSKTIIVKDMNDAIKVSNDTNGYRVITLDGEIINSWGSMVGGKTFKKEQNILVNRKKEIDKLDTKIKKLSEKLISLNDIKTEEISALDDLIYDLQNIDDKNKEELQNISNIKNNIRELEIELEFNDKRLEEYRLLLDNVTSELMEIDFSSIDDLIKELDNKQNKFEEINISINEINEQILSIDKELIKINTNLDVLKRDLEIEYNNIENLKIDIDNTNKSIEIDKTTLELTKNENKKSIERISELEKSSKDISSSTTEDRESIVNLSTQIKELKSKIENDRLEVEKLRDSLSENEKEKFKIELRVENQIQKVEDLKTDYIETYSLDENILNEKLERVEIVDASRKEVNDIKTRLSKIGYFNFETIEQFNLISEQLDFMKQQYQDLVKSRDDIIKMIKSIEKDMKENFIDSFEKIRVKFNEIYGIFFDGRKADLKLDSEDILTAGIDIIATPKGKKLKSIALLSGGEKAMTAVALLFAIFEINPAPFCVLDEIDAALDEANIKRYITYLKSLVDKTQFIIITHRKATMEMAEILYGVTMEQDGISKIVTLALDNYN